MGEDVRLELRRLSESTVLRGVEIATLCIIKIIKVFHSRFGRLVIYLYLKKYIYYSLPIARMHIECTAYIKPALGVWQPFASSDFNETKSHLLKHLNKSE